MSPLVLPSLDMQFHSQAHTHRSVPKIICQEEEEGDDEENKSTLWSDMQEEEEDEEEELIRMMLMHSQSQSQSHPLSSSPSHSSLHSSEEESIEMDMNLFTIEEDPWAEKMAELEQKEEYSTGLSQEHEHLHKHGHNRYISTMKRRGCNPIIQQSHLFLS